MSDLVVEESPLIAYQHCSKGKIRSIEPLPTVHLSGDVEVVCSVEQNETASRLMVWRFQSSAIQTSTKLRSSTYSHSGTINKVSDIRNPLLSEDLNIELPCQTEQKSDHSYQTDNHLKSLKANTLPNMGHQNTSENFQEHLLLQDDTAGEDTPNGDERETDSQDLDNHFYL